MTKDSIVKSQIKNTNKRNVFKTIDIKRTNIYHGLAKYMFSVHCYWRRLHVKNWKKNAKKVQDTK